MEIAPRVGGLLPLLAGLLVAGCGGTAAPSATQVAAQNPGGDPATGSEVALPEEVPAPAEPPAYAVTTRKVEGLPTADRTALRKKYLPVIDQNNRQPPKPFAEPPSPLENQKPEEMDPALVKKVNRLKQWAGFLRGKKLKGEIQLAQMAEKEVGAMLLDEKNQEQPPETIFAQEEEGIALGFFPNDLDVKKMMAELMASGVGAFYEPKSKHFVMVIHDNGQQKDPVVKAFQEISDEITSVHELTHAVQDQYFDLLKMLPPDEPSDQAAAVRALVEGDATYVMLEYGLARQTGGKRPDLLSKGTGQQLVEAMGASLSSLDNNPMVPENTARVMKLAPRVLSEELMFSYGHGFGLVYALHQAGDTHGAAGAGGVKGQIGTMDAAFKQPPESTEQILHPEKYLDPKKYDPPTFLSKVDLTQAPAEKANAPTLAGYTLVGSDEMGEFRMRLWFEEILRGGLYSYRTQELKSRPRPNRQQRETAEVAATGWDGCRVTTYEKTDAAGHTRIVLTLVAEFDSPEDAQQARDVVLARAQQMAPTGAKTEVLPMASLPIGTHQEVELKGGFGSHAVQQQGARLVYVQDAEGDTATALAARLMAETQATASTKKAPDLTTAPITGGGAEDKEPAEEAPAPADK